MSRRRFNWAMLLPALVIGTLVLAPIGAVLLGDVAGQYLLKGH